MAPSVIFGKNPIADEILSPENIHGRPRDASLVYSTLFDVSTFVAIIIIMR